MKVRYGRRVLFSPELFYRRFLFFQTGRKRFHALTTLRRFLFFCTALAALLPAAVFYTALAVALLIASPAAAPLAAQSKAIDSPKSDTPKSGTPKNGGSQFDAGGSDTLRVYKSPEIKVETARVKPDAVSITPTQTLERETLDRLSVFTVADAVRGLSGVSLRDYGGIGGLKTVSVRSLGAEHTAVLLDGISMSDAQTGQIDVGRLALESLQTVALTNGAPSGDCLPARAYAAQSTLTLTSRAKNFSDFTAPLSIRAGLTGGSFGLFNFRLGGESRLSPSLYAAASLDRTAASGQYFYLLQSGQSGAGTSSATGAALWLTRRNADVQTTRLEADFGATLSQQTSLHAKVYYYAAERGLPGAAIFRYDETGALSEALIENSQQRLWNRDFFVQATLTLAPSPNTKLSVSAKASENFLRYADLQTATPGAQSIAEDDHYTEREFYASLSVTHRLFPNTKLSLASDVARTSLDGSRFERARPNRFSSLTAVAAQTSFRTVRAEANLLLTHVAEETASGNAAALRWEASPTVALGYAPIERLAFRASYKNSFRLPTFSDLYYARIGNPDLRPERAEQLNLGAGIELPQTPLWKSAAVRADGFRIWTADKIVAIPRQNLFEWSIQNIGRVETTGIEAHLDLVLPPLAGTDWTLAASYTYQEATDKTPPDRPSEQQTFNKQLAYTPFESFSIAVIGITKMVSVNTTLSYSGFRYSLNENTPSSLLPAVLLIDAGVTVKPRVWETDLSLKAEVMNLGDVQYAVIQSFPMPGRSVRLGISLHY